MHPFWQAMIAATVGSYWAHLVLYHWIGVNHR